MSNYKAIKNLLHNTNGIDRKYLKEVVRECCREIVNEEIQRFMQTREFLHYFCEKNRYEIKCMIANKLSENIEIKVKE